MAVVYRDARTGRYVTAAYAKRFPEYTVAETVHPLKWLAAHLATLAPRR